MPTTLLSLFVTLAQSPTLAPPAPYRPFIDPIELHDHWYWLIIPMSFLLSLAYKSVRVHDIRGLPRAVLSMTIQVIAAMIALGAFFYLFIEFILPLIAPR